MPRFSKSIRVVSGSLAVFFCIPLLYLLSTGPMAFLWRMLEWDKSSIGNAVSAFYSPLDSVITKSRSPSGVGLRAYMGVWGEDIPEPIVDTLAPPAPSQRSPREPIQLRD